MHLKIVKKKNCAQSYKRKKCPQSFDHAEKIFFVHKKIDCSFQHSFSLMRISEHGHDKMLFTSCHSLRVVHDSMPRILHPNFVTLMLFTQHSTQKVMHLKFVKKKNCTPSYRHKKFGVQIFFFQNQNQNQN